MGIQVKNKASKGEIYIFDEIGSGFFGGVGLKDVAAALKDLRGVNEITLRINSPGGDMFEGIAIYNMLKKEPVKITSSIEGLAASAASIIALGADTVTMADSAFYMIHNAHTVAAGDTQYLAEVAEQLANFDEQLGRIYQGKIGGEIDDIREAMNVETWYTAAEAKEAGFIDDITEQLPVAAYCDPAKFRNAPQNLKIANNTESKRALAIAKKARSRLLRLNK